MRYASFSLGFRRGVNGLVESGCGKAGDAGYAFKTTE